MKPTKTVSIETLTAWAKQNSFESRMNSGGIDSYSNFVGEDLGAKIPLVSKSRDSDLVSQSNFDAALDMLGGESDSVEIHRFGHWGCGWIESIVINPTDEKVLRTGYEIKKLLEEYPLLDDRDYSERESKAVHELSMDFRHELSTSILEQLGLDGIENEDWNNSELVHEVSYLILVAFHEMYGIDAYLNIDGEISEYEMNRFHESLKLAREYQSYRDENEFMDLLCATFGIYDRSEF